jgi:hypothetical protein
MFQKLNNLIKAIKMEHILEFAREINWTPQWSGGAPLPQVFSNGHNTYLTYLTNDNDFAVIVTFNSSNSHRFGIVNDEAANGHPLYGKGLKVYRAHVIQNSSWIKELKEIHKVHPRYSDKHWTDHKHYLLFFHDEIFEVIAKDYTIERTNFSLEEAATEIVKRLYK